MPCHNGGQYIKFAIESIQAQTLSDWELLVIQNNSTDNSSEIVQSLRDKDARIQELDCQTPGAAAARNVGIAAARGRFIAFLDCDDQWLPNKLQEQIHLLEQESAAFSWASYEVMDAAGQTMRIQRCHTQTSYIDLLYKRKVIGCLTAIYDTHQFGKVMMPAIRMRQDYGLFLKLLRTAEQKGLRAIGLDQCVARYRVHAESMSHNKMRAAYFQWRLYRDIEKLPLMSSLAAMGRYFMHGIRDRA